MKLKIFMLVLIVCMISILANSGCQSNNSPTNDITVKRYGSLIKVRPEFEERYIILHKHTFPKVLGQIKNSNIQNYTIFLKDGILFSYFEYLGDDFKADMDKMGEDATTREWWKLTDPMQEPLDSRNEGEWWASMEEVFYMGEIRKPYHAAKRYGRVVELRPEHEEEYIKIHAEVWPSVLAQIQRSNIQNYSIFLKDGKLYSYFEYFGTDYKADMDMMAADPEIKRWLKITDQMQKKVPTAGEDEWWAEMEEVFHTD